MIELEVIIEVHSYLTLNALNTQYIHNTNNQSLERLYSTSTEMPVNIIRTNIK